MLGIEFAITHQIQYLYIESYLIASVSIALLSYIYKSQIQYYKRFILYILLFTSVLYFKISNNTCTDYDLKSTTAFYTGITNIILIVSSSTSKPNLLANLATLYTLNGSSLNFSETALITLFFISSIPLIWINYFPC